MWFRRALGLGRSTLRAWAAGGAVATIALGTQLAAWVQLTVLVAVIAGALAAEGMPPRSRRLAAS